jgi:hypothetical protein
LVSSHFFLAEESNTAIEECMLILTPKMRVWNQILIEMINDHFDTNDMLLTKFGRIFNISHGKVIFLLGSVSSTETFSVGGISKILLGGDSQLTGQAFHCCELSC